MINQIGNLALKNLPCVTITYSLVTSHCQAVADPDQAFGGGSQIGGRQAGLNTKVGLRQSLSVTQKWLTLDAKKWLFLLVLLCDFSEKNHSLKGFYIINSENV